MDVSRLFMQDILIVNTPMKKQFWDSGRQKVKGADFKPMEIAFPDQANEIK